MGLISQLIASVVGGAIGGSFVLWGVNLQSHQRNDAALLALKVEVDRNFEALGEMRKGKKPGQADPGWLKHAIWDSQLPYVVQAIDYSTLLLLSCAYSTLDAVPSMTIKSTVAGVEIVRYQQGGWVDESLNGIYVAFSDAQRALENFEKRGLSATWRPRVKEAYEKARAALRFGALK